MFSFIHYHSDSQVEGGKLCTFLTGLKVITLNKDKGHVTLF